MCENILPERRHRPAADARGTGPSMPMGLRLMGWTERGAFWIIAANTVLRRGPKRACESSKHMNWQANKHGLFESMETYSRILGAVFIASIFEIHSLPAWNFGAGPGKKRGRFPFLRLRLQRSKGHRNKGTLPLTSVEEKREASPFFLFIQAQKKGSVPFS